MPLPDFTAFNPGYEEEKKRKRNAEKRIGQSSAPQTSLRELAQTTCFGRGSALKSGARSPLGVPPRFWQSDCHRLAQLQARHPGTWRERMIL